MNNLKGNFLGIFTLLSIITLFMVMVGVEVTSGEKILFVFPISSKSEKNVFQPIISEFARRGHEVVVVTSFAASGKEKNVREIIPTNFELQMKKFGDNPFKKREEGFWGMFAESVDWMFDSCEDIYGSKEFMELIHMKFDLIYMSGWMNDCLYGFLYKLKAPFITVVSCAAPNQITSYTGNRLPSSFVPSVMSDFKDEMTFMERMYNTFHNSFYDAFSHFFSIPRYEAIYRKHLGEDLPSISEIAHNVSAVMMNSHFTVTYPRPTLPNVFEVGGMHCGPVKPLPDDIEKFVSGAEHGLIFFSLGSVVQASTMPEEVRKIFVNVFSRLPQRVLWKWETGVMEDLPPNVKLGKWLPQQDILGHKNIKLFITHGGLLSTQEATYHGVPLLAIPIFGDQDLNAKKAERAGYCITVEILEMTENILENAIKTILNEKRFTDRAQELSKVFKDQPETPLERAMFWSEYIIRHKGAFHMQSAGRKLNFWQYHSIDVLATYGIIVLIILWIIKVIVVTIFRKICGSNKNKLKKQ